MRTANGELIGLIIATAVLLVVFITLPRIWQLGALLLGTAVAGTIGLIHDSFWLFPAFWLFAAALGILRELRQR